MSITEDYVSFEIAKLLIEKGFLANDRIYKAYNLKDKSLINSDGNLNYDTEIPAPTHQMAMKWLREVHNYFIEINYGSYVTEDSDSVTTQIGYSFTVQKKEKPTEHEYIHDWVYDTYEEAIEEAIKYVLNNNIKAN